jgi:hypothetical protein
MAQAFRNFPFPLVFALPIPRHPLQVAELLWANLYWFELFSNFSSRIYFLETQFQSVALFDFLRSS